MSKEQTPPELPKDVELVHDMRFTDDRVNALKGLAGLAGDAVEIKRYVGTEKTNDGVKHYMEYEDENGEKKIAPLDNFLWSHLSEERQAELTSAGMDAYNLDAGTDPLLLPSEEHDSSQAALDYLAEMTSRAVVGKLTAPRRRAKSSQPTQIDVGKNRDVTPEHFEVRVATHAAEHRKIKTQKEEESFAENRELIIKRERLDKLAEIAESVAGLLNAKSEEKKEEAKGIVGNEVHNIYLPEIVVEHSWVSRMSEGIATGLLDRVERVTGTHATICAEGWLLARTASIMNKRPVVQEVILGQDGSLYAYAISDQRYVESLLKGPLSRDKMRRTGQDVVVPWHVQLSNLPLPKGVRYDERTDPTVKNFYRLGDGNYPLPGIAGEGHIFADPAVIQQGLEDLVTEKKLLIA